MSTSVPIPFTEFRSYKTGARVHRCPYCTQHEPMTPMGWRRHMNSAHKGYTGAQADAAGVQQRSSRSESAVAPTRALEQGICVTMTQCPKCGHTVNYTGIEDPAKP